MPKAPFRHRSDGSNAVAPPIERKNGGSPRFVYLNGVKKVAQVGSARQNLMARDNRCPMLTFDRWRCRYEFALQQSPTIMTNNHKIILASLIDNGFISTASARQFEAAIQWVEANSTDYLDHRECGY